MDQKLFVCVFLFGRIWTLQKWRFVVFLFGLLGKRHEQGGLKSTSIKTDVEGGLLPFFHVFFFNPMGLDEGRGLKEVQRETTESFWVG